MTGKGNSYNGNPDYQRYNFRSNVDINLHPTTVLSLTLGGFLTKRRDAADSDGVWKRDVYKRQSIYKRGVNLHNPGESKLSNYELSYYTSTCWMGYHIDRLPLFPVFSFEKGYADGKCFCR